MAEKRLPTSDFRLLTSDFRLRTFDSDFELQTFDFRLPTSEFLERDICYGDAPLHIISSVYMNAAVQLNNSRYRQGDK